MGVKSTGSHPTTTQADGHLLEYFRQNFGAGGGGNAGPTSEFGITATGGVISDYTSGSDVYRAHIFTSSGTFNVSDIGPLGNTVEYLVIGGGGGGGFEAGGGGGAGAFRTNVPGHPYAQAAFTVSGSPGSYTVTIGAGGAAGAGDPISDQGSTGGNSVFGDITSPGGGGGGGQDPSGDRTGLPGGSGGGGAMSYQGGKGAYPGSPNPNPFRMGYDGGQGTDNGSDNIASAGGGGAGGAGANGTAPNGPGGAGGAGSPIAIESATAKLYAGGGGGGSKNAGGAGGTGGGGAGGGRNPGPLNGANATVSTGSGGGGSAVPPPAGDHGGHGASGIVVVRYVIGTISSAKATGGAISTFGTKTIHVFTSSGDFNNTTGSPLSVDVVMVGGGGAGGGKGAGSSRAAGGGGAGGYLFTPGSTVSPGPNTVTIGSGGASITSGMGDNGSNTTFNSLTAYGGGGGGGNPNTDGRHGGSGGGAANTGAGTSPGGNGNKITGSNSGIPAPMSPQGNPGGDSYDESGYGGGGGGGAGGAGGDFNNPPNTAGAGGVGVQIPSIYRNPDAAPSASSPLPYQNGGGIGTPGPTPGGFYLAGGGGGGAAESNPPGAGAGGAGGGGQGISSPFPGAYPSNVDAIQNTGGGGGGGRQTPSQRGGQGGSGIILIAYPT